MLIFPWFSYNYVAEHSLAITTVNSTKPPQNPNIISDKLPKNFDWMKVMPIWKLWISVTICISTFYLSLLQALRDTYFFYKGVKSLFLKMKIIGEKPFWSIGEKYAGALQYAGFCFGFTLKRSKFYLSMSWNTCPVLFSWNMLSGKGIETFSLGFDNLFFFCSI